MKQSAFSCLFLLFACFLHASGAPEPVRMIAILENERLLEAEPDIRLDSYFHVADPAIRARAVLAAGRIGYKSVIAQMAPLAKDQDVIVRRMVAFSLGQIRAKEGLPLVSLLMKDSDVEVRRLAVDACGRIGGIETAAMVRPFLNDPDPALREQAGLALALIKDKGTVDLLIQKAQAQDPAQWSYVYALYRLADERSLPALHQVLASASASPSTGDPSSVLFALKALWSMKKPLTPAEADSLLSAEDQRIQQNALDVLGAAGDASACAVIRSHMEKMPPQSRWKALDAMGVLNCATVEEQMKYLGSASPELRASALKLISAKEAEKYVAAFDRASHDDSWVVRAQAAESCAQLSADSALPILNRLVKDPDNAVQAAALESLGGFLPRTEEVILSALKSSDSVKRALAADALAKTKNRQYLPVLLEALEENNDMDTQTTILDALPDFADSTSLAALERALTDSRFVLRKHAVDSLKKIAGSSSYYLHGRAVNLDDFTIREGTVSAATIAKYPPDYGTAPAHEAVLHLVKGDVHIRLLDREAPVHVNNFVKLAESGFYKGLRIHRVVPNFVIQGGDPRGDGWGSAGVLVPDQFNLRPYKRGSVGMPTAGKDTGGCQFFITLSRQPHLDGNYTVFGEVISGMEAVDATELGDRILGVDLLPAGQ